MFFTSEKYGKTYSVGLDPSLSSFGAFTAPINHEEWYGFTVATTVKDGSDMRRCLDVADYVYSTVMDLPYLPSIIVFEDYGPINKTSGKITQRAEICGILKYRFSTLDRIPILTVSPKGLKKFATGNGNAKKEDVLNAAHGQGFTAETTDEADAYFAAKLGAYVLDGNRVNVDYTRLNPL